MSHNTEEIVYLGARNHYYMYDDELYTATFPVEWAKQHLPHTGPKMCNNCAFYGSYNGVFIGYCVNCALFVYKGSRGRGFEDYGVEQNTHYYDRVCQSAFDTYLKDIKLDDIGDTDIMNTTAMIENEKACKYEESTSSDNDIDDVDYNGGYSYGSHYDGGYDSY